MQFITLDTLFLASATMAGISFSLLSILTYVAAYRGPKAEHMERLKLAITLVLPTTIVFLGAIISAMLFQYTAISNFLTLSWLWFAAGILALLGVALAFFLSWWALPAESDSVCAKSSTPP
jgi:lysylphosphatidylglycerol synthetase-like protein (DUF2156 family)